MSQSQLFESIEQIVFEITSKSVTSSEEIESRKFLFDNFISSIENLSPLFRGIKIEVNPNALEYSAIINVVYKSEPYNNHPITTTLTLAEIINIVRSDVNDLESYLKIKARLVDNTLSFNSYILSALEQKLNEILQKRTK